MDSWFDNKWFVRAVSLAFAILLYVFVNIEVATTTDSRVPGESDRVEVLEDVPVDILIDEEKYVVSGVPEVVTVSLEGPHSILTPKAKQRNFDIFVDLREFEEGEYSVEIEHDRIPEELSVYIEPKTIDIVIEERATEEFAVNVDFINEDQLPEGYELGTPEVKPETITITSSRSIIEQIAMVKVFVDVAGLTEPINNREVPVNVYDNQGNGLNVRATPENVVVSVNVDNPSKMVDVTVKTKGELPEDYELNSISPSVEEVEVFATSDVLNTIEELSTNEIDLSEVTESGSIDVDLDVPEGAQVEEERIEVNIDLEMTKVIEDVPIDVKNLAKDAKIRFIDPDQPSISITVVGNEKDVRDLTKDDFTVTIDVEDLAEGEHEVPLSIKGPDQVDYKAKTDSVKIEIM